MISTRDIRRKIKTIRNIQQMCRAMKTVSLVKLQKAELRLVAARPYAERMSHALARLLGEMGENFLSLEGEHVAIVITSDKGLCGGYNASVLRLSQKELAKESPIIAMGRKGERFLRRRRYRIIESLVPLGSEPTFARVAPFADAIMKRIRDGEIASLSVIHGRFLRGTRSEMASYNLFPIEAEDDEVIFEPPAPQMAEALLQSYLRAALYAAVLESSASEHGARAAAMTAASDNADKVIRQLVMDCNRARQASITKELSEIVGSSDALV